MNIRSSNGTRMITELSPIDRKILMVLYDSQKEFTSTEMANRIRKSVGYTRSRLNTMAAHPSRIVLKHKKSGAAPWHDDLGKKGAPVTQETVEDYMKKRGIKRTPEKVREIFDMLWEEAEALGRWVDLSPNLYSANPDLGLERRNVALLLKKR